MDLRESGLLDEEIGQHWYYKSKARAVRKLLSGKTPEIILDVGAGSGFFSQDLLAETAARESWCVDISYPDESDVQKGGKTIHFRRSVGETNADVVLLMDVLEHVDDDVGLLKQYVDKVPRGARFLISVPAFSFLWSGHDVFLEHRRRYRLEQVEQVVRQAGLTVKRGSYFFGMVFPIAAAVRLSGNLLSRGGGEPRSQMSRHHPAVNGILGLMCACELPLFPHNRVAGLSVFCLAEKS